MIKGLTDRGGSLPRIGELRKGAAKGNSNAPGKDLPYFRFTTKLPEVAEAFVAHYGQEPAEIEITFPYQTTDENFEAWQEEWVAGGLRHRCDGNTCVLLRDPGGKLNQSNAPCPGKCKPVGRLGVILPRLGRLATVTVLTTSLHDITAIHQSLLVIETLRGSLRGIPFILRRRPKRISIPGKDGKPVKAEKWLIELEAAPQWVTHQLIAMEQAALPPAPLDDSDESGTEQIGDVTTDGEIIEHPPILEEADSHHNPSHVEPQKQPLIAQCCAMIERLSALEHEEFRKGDGRKGRILNHLRRTARQHNYECDWRSLEGLNDLTVGELSDYYKVLEAEEARLHPIKAAEEEEPLP